MPKGTYLLSSLQSLPDSAEMGRDSVSEERISGSFRWEVFWGQWNGQAVFNSLLFDFWYHHPIIINVCPPKRYLSFFPQIILPCCFLSTDFPLFYFLLFGKTNHSLFASDLGCLTPCPRDQQIKCFVDPCMFNYCSPSERCIPCNCKWCYPVCVPAYKGLAPGG